MYRHRKFKWTQGPTAASDRRDLKDKLVHFSTNYQSE